jgi:hypothetical protein
VQGRAPRIDGGWPSLFGYLVHTRIGCPFTQTTPQSIGLPLPRTISEEPGVQDESGLALDVSGKNTLAVRVAPALLNDVRQLASMFDSGIRGS